MGLELDPTLTQRLKITIDTAEKQNTNDARLDAFNQVHQIGSWLNHRV